jgi:hypothetical protein
MPRHRLTPDKRREDGEWLSVTAALKEVFAVIGLPLEFNIGRAYDLS